MCLNSPCDFLDGIQGLLSKERQFALTFTKSKHGVIGSALKIPTECRPDVQAVAKLGQDSGGTGGMGIGGASVPKTQEAVHFGPRGTWKARPRGQRGGGQ